MSGVHWYMVRAGKRGAEFVEEFLEQKRAFIGFVTADLTDATDKAAIREQLEVANPKEAKRRLDVGAAQVHRFRNIFQKGDYVVAFDSAARVYHVGTIASDYRYDPKCRFPHVRDVNWIGKVPRDVLSVETRNTLGAIATIFAIEGKAKEELEARLTSPTAVPEKVAPAQVEEDVEAYFRETERRAADLIADAFDSIGPDEMVDLVEALLEATGYHARRGDKGADRGVDLYASPDPWMVKSPRIKVQVKHRDDAMGGPEVRNFIGTLQDGETGIYVSTGGFSKDGRYEAERSSRAVSLIDRDALIALYLEHHDHLDEEIRALVPVKRVFLPVKVGAE